MARNQRNTADERIPAEEFKVALLSLKSDLGLSWAQMAERTGRSRGTLSSYTNPKRVWVGKSTAEDILRRLKGQSRPPTPSQQASYTSLRRKDQSDQRSQTLADRKRLVRKAQIDELRQRLGQV